MRIATGYSMQKNVKDAVDEAVAMVKKSLDDVHYCVVFCTVEYDVEEVEKLIAQSFPLAKIHGGTSCQGIMTENGFVSNNGRALGIWALSDRDSVFGVGYKERGEDPFTDAVEAVKMALKDAGRLGEAPDLVLLTATPGCEEAAIKGIESLVGKDVPIAGGSPADNTIEGKWKSFTRGKTYGQGIMVSVFFTSSLIDVGVAFSSGYLPTEHVGLVTKAEGRILYEIDHRPAAVVYNEWIGGVIQEAVDAGGGVILGKTTLYPLGREVGKMGTVPYYMLSHPEKVLSNKAMTLFTEVAVGERIELMTGSLQSLATRAGRVAAFLTEHDMRFREIAGAFIVYCAGCMLTVGEKIADVVDGLKQHLVGVPFMGVFTFGEQGCFKNGESKHGNLMISVIIFGRR